MLFILFVVFLVFIAFIAFIGRRRRRWSLLVKIEGDPLKEEEEEVFTRENRGGS